MANLVTRRHVDGSLVNSGDTVTNFRGDDAIFIRATRPRSPGHSGKVQVEWPDGDGGSFTGEYYDNVFDLAVTAE